MPSAPLKYSDTTDRAYGLCGMALALFIYDSEDYIESLSLDAQADEGLGLTPDFFFADNQNCSAKAVWKAQYRMFQITSAMLIGNLLCRSIIRRKSDLSREVSNLLLSHLLNEGEDRCGLESSEVREILAEPFSYLRRIFLHPRVADTLTTMATDLSRAKTLPRDQVLHYLRPLNRL